MSETTHAFGGGYSPASDDVDLLAPPTPDELDTGDRSVLEELKAALEKPVETKPALIDVPARPGVQIRCHTRMTQEQRKAWQNRARKKKGRRADPDAELDDMLFACLVIANTCEAVLFEGIEAHDSEGTPLSFRHAQLWEMVGKKEPQDAIRAFFGVDAHVLIASGEVLLASGFDDDLRAEDPTTAG